MAGTLVITTLSDGTNSTSATNPILGSAKAWCKFNGSTGALIGTPFNVSSITKNGTGSYNINFSTAMPNANYSVPVSTNGSGSGGIPIGGVVTYTTTYCTVQTTTTASVVDNTANSVAVFSS